MLPTVLIALLFANIIFYEYFVFPSETYLLFSRHTGRVIIIP